MTAEAHVLVVDDDVRLRALLSRYLVEQGFRVTAASHAAEARDKLRVVQPDLQVVVNPGGGVADPKRPGKRIGDAAVLGVRSVVTF